MKRKIVLASASASRAALMENVGIVVEKDPAAINEDDVKNSFRKRNGTAVQVAEALAEIKAQHVSRRHNDAYVIGADQMMQCDGLWFDKPENLNRARAHLMALRGKTHELLSAVCVARNGRCVWRHMETAQLTMRPVSDRFLDEYFASVGEKACLSVGAYQLEGWGARLFSRIEGDYFSILGLPLLPLLGFLMNEGLVTE